MFERVLVPTDFSRYSLKMLECIAEIPGVMEVVLLNVADSSNPMNLEKKGWSFDSFIDEAQAHLQEEAESLNEFGLSVKTLLDVIVEPMSGADGVNMQPLEPRSDVILIDGGSIGEAIQKAAADEKVSLVVMGAQGKGLVEGILLGSVSTDVLRHGHTDLLIVRHKLLEGPEARVEKFCQNIFSRVIVTTDFSPAASGALSIAKGLQGVQEILLAHVISKGKSIDEAAKRLQLLRDDLAAQDRKVTVHVLEGHPADEILKLAAKQDASLVVMCSQGKSWSKQMRVGSTTFDVARRAECPILVIRSGQS